MERLIEFAGNHLYLVTLFIAILMLLLWNLYGSLLSGTTQLEPGDVIRMMNQDHAAVLDIRAPGDFEAGHILNAINIPNDELNDKRKELNKYQQKPLIVYCENGTVSTHAIRLLKAGGFEKVFGLKGGLAAWRNATLPLARGRE